MSKNTEVLCTILGFIVFILAALRFLKWDAERSRKKFISKIKVSIPGASDEEAEKIMQLAIEAGQAEARRSK